MDRRRDGGGVRIGCERLAICRWMSRTRPRWSSDFESGMLGEIHLDCIQRGYSRRCVLIGSEGTVRWDSTVRPAHHVGDGFRARRATGAAAKRSLRRRDAGLSRRRVRRLASDRRRQARCSTSSLRRANHRRPGGRSRCDDRRHRAGADGLDTAARQGARGSSAADPSCDTCCARAAEIAGVDEVVLAIPEGAEDDLLDAVARRMRRARRARRARRTSSTAITPPRNSSEAPTRWCASPPIVRCSIRRSSAAWSYAVRRRRCRLRLEHPSADVSRRL